MPHFTSSITNLQQVGPVIDGAVGVTQAAADALTVANQPVPAPVDIAIMVDTGAFGSVIKTGIPQQLGLNPVGQTMVNTPSSQQVPCDVYAVQFVLPGNMVAEASAVEAPLPGQTIQALIGRDLLAFGVMIYIGSEDQFTLSF